MNVHQTALSALEAGLSTIPPKVDSKAPIAGWKQYQEHPPTREIVNGWYSNGQAGVGLITGFGNLECLDYDTPEAWEQFKQAGREAGLWELVKRVAFGYSEQSPHGFHLLYRCESIAGNLKLAQAPDKKTLIETRGEGGFIIVAPTTKPDGDYTLKAGGFDSIVTITPDEREQLHGLARTLDESPRKTQHQTTTVGSGDRPGDVFTRTHTWEQVLEPHGWVKLSEQNGTTTWKRPGKDEGESATTNHNGSDLLWVFSTSTVFESERSYDKFGAHVQLNYNGDFTAATRDLGGTQTNSQPDEPVQWPEIIPLSTALPKVESFDYALLPEAIAPWVRDIVERVQCPPDFIAVAVMVALASVLGRKAAIYPKQFDDWLVIPNLWGALIGRPSTMKSPAMAEGLRPLKRLAIAARKDYREAMTAYRTDELTDNLTEDVLKSEMKRAIAKKKVVAIEEAKKAYTQAQSEQVQPPNERRYIVNDSTIEKLGELLNENPVGLLLERDELIGWLRNLDREDRAADRAFYLECFNGSSSNTYDRIGRRTVHIDSTTLSVIGGIQPSKLQPCVWNATNQGIGDDGLMQRFQLCVYPDDPGEWQHVDRWPDKDVKARAFQVFESLDNAVPLETDEEGRVQGVRFTPEGQAVFNEWRGELERKVRAPDIHPAIESHLVKYRSLMPSLALLINAVELGHDKAVTERSAIKAAAWVEYLESHANRIYSAAINPDVQNALTILNRRDKLPSEFKVKEVQQKGWAGLSETDQVKKALAELLDSGHLIEKKTQATPDGGRPSFSYFWNLKLQEQGI